MLIRSQVLSGSVKVKRHLPFCFLVPDQYLMSGYLLLSEGELVLWVWTFSCLALVERAACGDLGCSAQVGGVFLWESRLGHARADFLMTSPLSAVIRGHSFEMTELFELLEGQGLVGLAGVSLA